MPLSNTVAKFLSSVPAVCGFYPEESLVLIHMKPDYAGRENPGLTMRLDIARFGAAPKNWSDVLIDRLSTQPPGGVIGIVVSKKDGRGTGLPWSKEIETLTSSIAATHHTVRAIYFLPEFSKGVEFRCYCSLPDCGGVLPDPTASPGALAAAAAGFAIQPSRRAVEGLFVQASAAELAPIAAATQRAIERLEESPQPLADKLAAFDSAVAASSGGPLPTDHEHIAHLLASFTSPLFCDACVVSASASQPELDRLNLLLHLHRLAPSELRPQTGTALAAAYCLVGEYLHASLAAESVQSPTPLADFVAIRVNRGADPHAPGNEFSGYFRAVRDGAAVVTRTVGTEAERNPRLLSLVTEAVLKIEGEHDRRDYRALKVRLDRIDSAVAASATGRRPRADEELAGLIASMSSPRIRDAALVPPTGSGLERDAIALFRHLLQVAPLDFAGYLAGAVAFGELAQGDIRAARIAAVSVDPPSILAETVRLATLAPADALQAVGVTDMARAARLRLERAAGD